MISKTSPRPETL